MPGIRRVRFPVDRERSVKRNKLIKERAYSAKIRRYHFRQFMSLPAEQQLAWAISHGYELLALLPEDIKLTLEEFRNGTKKNSFAFQNSRKST